MDITSELYNYGIVPVVKINDASKAVRLAKALSEGGLPCAEITFRTAEGRQAIKNISSEMPEMFVGAGTVLTTAQVDEAVSAGAKFIVAPGFNPDVVAYCIEKDIPVFPGCTTPSDMERAIQMGLTTVKLFPAESVGGIDYIKAVSAPYGSLKFMPTGGVNEKNINNYLSFDKIVACGGSWMVKDELINNDRFDEITALTKTAVKTIMGFELAHVGINTGSEDEALNAARRFNALFGFESKPGNSSVFSDKYIECMKNGGLGEKGHIAIATNNVSRAVSYLERNGFKFNMETVKKNTSGKINAVYLDEEIAGFAVHLVQKLI